MKTLEDCYRQFNTQSISNAAYNVATAVRDQEKKADAGKPRMELIPTSVFKSLGRVLTFGAEKYSPNSWQTVQTDRYVGALLRHLCAFIEDPNGVDAESGLKHSEHLLTNAAFINDAVMRGDYEISKDPG